MPIRIPNAIVVSVLTIGWVLMFLFNAFRPKVSDLQLEKRIVTTLGYPLRAIS